MVHLAMMICLQVCGIMDTRILHKNGKCGVLLYVQAMISRRLVAAGTSSIWLGVHLENRSNGGIDALVLEPLRHIGIATLHKAMLLQQVCKY